MRPTASIPLFVSLSLCLSGCATDTFMPTPMQSPAKTSSNAGITSGYVLTSEELALPCNKLRGRIQLRILEVRDRSKKVQPSAIANSLRWDADTSGIWHEKGSLSDIGSTHDMAVLTAYNKRLTQLGCQNYDIVTELDHAKSRVWQVQ